MPLSQGLSILALAPIGQKLAMQMQGSETTFSWEGLYGYRVLPNDEWWLAHIAGLGRSRARQKQASCRSSHLISALLAQKRSKRGEVCHGDGQSKMVQRDQGIRLHPAG